MKNLLFTLVLMLPLLSIGQWTQLGNDMPGIPGSDAEFGNQVDFNSAGDIMIGGANSNYAKVFQENNGVWTQLGQTLSGSIGEGYGWAVSINGIGNIIAVGEYGDVGRVHVYELVEDVWTPLGAPIEGGINNGYFDNLGFTVDLSDDGMRVAAGAFYANLGGGVESGYAVIHDLIEGVWTPVGNPIAGTFANQQFGSIVELSADGSRIVIGSDGSATGVYVYEETGGSWDLLGQPILSSEIGPGSAYTPTINKAGNTIAFLHYAGTRSTRVYSLIDGDWVQKGNTLGVGGPCSLNADGNFLAISYSYNSNSSSAWVYQFVDNDWALVDEMISGEDGDYLGVSNSLNDAGNRLLLGAVGIGSDLTGATQVYSNNNISYNPIPYISELPEVLSECEVSSIEPPEAYNNNSDAIIGTTDATFPLTSSTTITWTYTDEDGLNSSQNQSVTIEDTTAPIPSMAELENIESQCEVTELTAPTATDNCSEVTVTNDAILPITSQGTTSITWTYTDDSGNQTMQNQTVNIQDTTAPTPSAEQLGTIDAQCEVTELIAPTATDNCSEVIVSNDAVLPITAQGSTSIIWTYTDDSGNQSTQNQTVIIQDTTAPVPTAENLLVVEAGCEVTELIAPTATDNCSEVTVTNDAVLPITFEGVTAITWTYTDNSGNSSTQLQMVFIEDTFAPVPDVAELEDIESACDVVVLNPPSATDDCSSDVLVTNNATLPIVDSGTTTIVWTFADDNGNSSTQTQDVVITPLEATITEDGNTLISDQQNVSYQWVECNFVIEEIDGETNPTFLPTESGSYAVVIDNGQCEATSECITVTIVGVIENTFDYDLLVFPNPTSGNLSIDLGEQLERVSLTLLDMNGKVLHSENYQHSQLLRLNLEAESGVYILKIDSKEKNAVVRLIKE